MRLAFATCAEWSDLTPDDRLALPFLSDMGITVCPYVWDQAVPSDVDAIVVRSCWDYHVKTEAFSRWLAAPPARLFNAASALRWNLHKTYLEDLRTWGFHVPRTVWIEAGSQGDLHRLLQENGLDQAVVKPAVGMNGFDTWRTSRAEAAAHQGRLESLTESRSVMIQEFISEVLSHGETSLIFLDGSFSHAVSKHAAPGEFRIHEEYGGTRRAVTPDASILDEARRILARVGESLLYARVDGVVSGGHLVIMEVELIDPALFLSYDAEAPARFAAATARHVYGLS